MDDARIRANGELTEAIAQYPDRFIGFGTVPADLDFNGTMNFVHDFVYKKGLKGQGEFTLGSGSVNVLETSLKVSSEFGFLPLWGSGCSSADCLFSRIRSVFILDTNTII